MDFLNNTNIVVGIGFVIFLAILVYYKVPAMLAAKLDERSVRIRADLDEARALRDEEITDTHRTRLWLNDATRQVLANGLDLLGVSAPERM